MEATELQPILDGLRAKTLQVDLVHERPVNNVGAYEPARQASAERSERIVRGWRLLVVRREGMPPEECGPANPEQVAQLANAGANRIE